MWASAQDARDGILSIWETADVIKISEEEVSFLTSGEDPYDDAVVKKLIHPNLKLLLVTQGPDGCRYYSKVILRTFDLELLLLFLALACNVLIVPP